MARYLKFEDIRFYNLSVYHYNLRDKQNCIITGYAAWLCSININVCRVRKEIIGDKKWEVSIPIPEKKEPGTNSAITTYISH